MRKSFTRGSGVGACSHHTQRMFGSHISASLSYLTSSSLLHSCRSASSSAFQSDASASTRHNNNNANRAAGRAAFAAYLQYHNNEVNTRGDLAFHHVDEKKPQKQPNTSTNGSKTRRSFPGKHSESPSRNNSTALSDDSLLSSSSSPARVKQQWQLQKRAVLESRQHASNHHAKPEFQSILKQVKNILEQSPPADARDYELRYQSMLLALRGLLIRLLDHHYIAASPSELVELLRCVGVSGVQAGYVAMSCITQLTRLRAVMRGKELVFALNALSELDDSQGVPYQARANVAASLGSVLLDTMEDQFFKEIHPNTLCKLLYATMPTALRRPSATLREAAPIPVFGEGFGHAFLLAMLRQALVRKPLATTSTGSKLSEEGAMERPTIHNGLKLSHITCVACAIAHHKVPNEHALEFLSAAAPMLQEGVLDLTARQLSLILAAYAGVGYRNVEWFVAVGQRAGDLGERMHEDDAARILQAFEQVQIEHETLRKSLESSLRMKSLRRSQLYNKIF